MLRAFLTISRFLSRQRHIHALSQKYAAGETYEDLVSAYPRLTALAALVDCTEEDVAHWRSDSDLISQQLLYLLCCRRHLWSAGTGF